MYPTRKLPLLLCASLLTAVQIQAALAQAVEAATQSATLAATAPAPEPATLPATTLAAATEPSTEAATGPATAASTEPSTTPATAPTTLRAGSKLSLNFKDASVDSVLDHLSEAAGFVVLKETPVEGRVTVLSKQPVTPEEAVVLLNTVLKNNGYTAIQTGRILKIVSRATAKKSNVPVYFGADPDKIAKTDEMITQVIPVANVDAVKLRTDLTPLLNIDADVAANAGSNSIVVTDSSANIRRLVEIIVAIDQHRSGASDIKVIQLKYASATAAAKLITDIFQPATPAGGNAGGNMGGPAGRFAAFFGGGRGGNGGGPGGAGNTGTAGNGNDALNGRVLASADDRTNTLVVSGPTETLKLVETVVTKLDANPAEGQTTFIYNLKNGQSLNLQNVLNTLFGVSSGSSGYSSTNRTNGSTGFGGSSFGGSSSFGSTNGNRGMGSSSRGGMSSGMSGGGRTNGSSSYSGSSNGNRNGFGGGYGGGMPSLSAANSRAASDLSGQVFVVAEADTNSLLVTTNAKYVDRVKQILDELDRAVPQVLIKVLIAEVTHANSDDIGVEWSIFTKNPTAYPVSGGPNFNIAKAIAAGAPGLVFSMTEANATAALRALATTTKVDVLSRPYILASDNQLASIMSGQEVPYITNSNITTVGVSNSVAYQDVGIILNVTPHINPDGLVILDVNPQISSLDTSVNSVQISQDVSAPVFNLRQAQSRVAVKNGQTIIIGGLMQDKKNQKVDKIPLLGDIPYLGALFRHSVDTKEKTELLIFLTPHVAQQPGLLQAMSQQEQQGTKLVPNAVAPGVFQEHMIGMERGATTLPAAPQPPESLNNDPAH